MTLAEIQLVCDLPNYTSFADASFYLPYSPSLITKYVNHVEEELGIQIFVRSNRSKYLELTPEGNMVIESFKRLIDEYSYLKKQIQQLKNENSTLLKIGSQPRYGNIHEQAIISNFLFEKPALQLSIKKEAADELIRHLISGKIDAAFITFHDSLPLDSYFGERHSKLDVTYLLSEKEMYVGISDQYFPNRTEICLKELEDFTFAFPFPNANDYQSAHATDSWISIAKEKGMHLNYMNLQGYDDTVFQLATVRKIAVTTSHIPTSQPTGIHFLRISDWTGCTNLYFLTLKNQSSRMVKDLKHCVLNYRTVYKRTNNL